MTDRPVQARTITMEARRVGDTTLEVAGRLVDDRPRGTGVGWFGTADGSTIHDMRVTLRVRFPDLVILGVSAEMVSRPYTLCADAVEPLQQLVGLSVAQGFTRAVNERFGRQLGCAHVTSLIHAMAPVVKQAAGVAFASPDEPVVPDERELCVIDTCQAWREDGLLHRLVRAGDAEGLQNISAYRPPSDGSDPTL